MPPAYSFGTSQRGHAKKSNEEGPGPGVMITWPRNIIIGGPRLGGIQKIPYDQRIGNQQRGKNDFVDTPGPGQYDNSFVTVRNAPSPSTNSVQRSRIMRWGRELHVSQIRSIFIAGPGAYENYYRPILKSSSQYSFGLRLQKGGSDDALQETRNGPGPAAYETNYSTLFRPSSRIGTQTRGDLHSSQMKVVPGVGNYNVRPSTAGPFYGFGSSTRDQNFMTVTKQTPGPGTYEYQSAIKGSSNGKTMSKKHQLPPDERENVPGPGTYESYVEQVKRGNPKYRIGTANRTQTTDSHVPGPGAYVAQPNDKRRPPSYKIGTENRGHILDQQTPGPGAYEIKRDIDTGKKYIMGLKPDPRAFDETPGPQDYYPEVEQTHLRPASCKVGSERRDYTNAANRENPGPDQYNVAKDIGGPKYPFGSQMRGAQKGENFPGPGQYDIPPYFANNPEYLIPNQSRSMQSFTRTK